MKKKNIILLALVISMQLIACGGGSTQNTTSADKEKTTNTSSVDQEKTTDTTSADEEKTTDTSSADVVGEYKNVGILMNENVTYQLNDDETFDKKADITSLTFKGLYTITKDGFRLKVNKQSFMENFVRQGDYLYNTEGGITYFDTDEEYGKTITLDSNGRTNQSFQTYYYDINRSSTGSSTYYVLTIEFNKDGTFKLYKFYIDMTNWSTTNREQFEGTYSANDEIITLNYNNADHILLIVGEKLYFDVIQKTDK